MLSLTVSAPFSKNQLNWCQEYNCLLRTKQKSQILQKEGSSLYMYVFLISTAYTRIDIRWY